MSTPNGTTSEALVAADVAHVAWAVNLGCLGFHVWPNEADDPDHADELRIDLDPQPGVTFDDVRAAAAETHALFDELGIEAAPKTTGNRGIHVYVRLAREWSPIEVRAGAVAIARELARRRPDSITDAWWKEERGDRVFVDFNQNAPHKTVFGAWSVRARPGAQVSTPFAWDELDDIEPDALTIATVPPRVAARGDPWAGIDERPQSLLPLLEMSARDLASGLQDAPWPPVYPKMPGEPPRVAPSRAKKPGASKPAELRRSAPGEGAAVDAVELAGDPRPLVGAEVDDHPRDVVAGAGPSERHDPAHHLVPRLAARDVVHAVRVDEAGADHVDADTSSARAPAPSRS